MRAYRVAGVGSSKGFLVKEFGLVSANVANRTIMEFQNMTFVDDMLGLCAGTRLCAGSLFWSLRSHAEEGGFHWHRESGGDIVALHWPGFTVGGPNYEREVFDAIRVTNGVAPASDPSAYPLAPPALESLPNSSQFSPPCAGFRGSTGAQFYELWARDNRTAGAREWVVVSEGISDVLTPRASYASMDARILVSRIGKMAQYDLCLRACAGVNTSRVDDRRCHYANATDPEGDSCDRYVRSVGCSECSPWLTLDMDALLPGQHPACASVSFGAFDSTTYYNDELSSYFAHSENAEARAVLLGLVCAAALLVLMARVSPTGCCPVGIHRGRRLGRSLRSGLLCAWARRLVKLARSPRRWLFPDALVTPSAAGAAAGTGAGAGSGADLVAGVGAVGDAPPRVVAVDVLRLLCVVWIGGATLVGLPHGLSTLSAFGWGTRAAAALSWGVGCYPLLFVASGFLTATRHAHAAHTHPVWPLLRARAAKMYPAFAATALAGCVVQHLAYQSYLLVSYNAAPSSAISGAYVLMLPFCLCAWHPALRLANAANLPSFVVGALLMDAAVSLPILARLSAISSRALGGVMLLSYAATWWQVCAHGLAITRDLL